MLAGGSKESPATLSAGDFSNWPLAEQG